MKVSIFCIALSAFVFPLAAAEKTGQLEGTIVSRDAAKNDLTVRHGEVKGVMGAMTMAFKAPKDGLPPDIKPGMNVRFQFTLTPQGDMQLRSIVLAEAPAQSGMKK